MWHIHDEKRSANFVIYILSPKPELHEYYEINSVHWTVYRDKKYNVPNNWKYLILFILLLPPQIYNALEVCAEYSGYWISLLYLLERLHINI